MAADKYVVKQEWAREDYPALYRCADDASTKAQCCYLRWVSINLSLLVLGSLAGSYGFVEIPHKRGAQVVSALCFFSALGVSILLAARRWEKVWYGGRAVAESIKSLMWKYVTSASPFDSTVPERQAVEQFVGSLNELLQENTALACAFSTGDVGEQVPGIMNQLRGSAVGVLRDVYLEQRVVNQRLWYTDQSVKNKNYRNAWFTLLAAFQGIAGIISLYLIFDPVFPWRGAAAFSTLASATVAWGQVRRFQELAQAYALAAQELSLIAQRGQYVQTRADLSRFVNDAETAISREHSSWIARREAR